jgi:hypothetical protein
VNKEETLDEQLEERINRMFQDSETKRDIFNNIRKEKDSLQVKEKRIIDTFKL